MPTEKPNEKLPRASFYYRVSWSTLLYLLALALIFVAWGLSRVGLIHIVRRTPDVR